MKLTTQQWLDFAQTDLRSCENNLQDSFVTNIVAFHAQQTVEKALKALFEEKGIAVPKAHNLTHLHSVIEPFLIVPINILELDQLDSVYTSSLYPGNIGIISTGKPTLTESVELYEIAKKIYAIIMQTIEK